MHISIEKLRDLANSYIKKELLTDEQVKLKQHMGDCDECYEKFCAEVVMMNTLLKRGLVMPEAFGYQEETSVLERVCLKIQMVNDKLNLISEKVMESADSLWSFTDFSSLAVARGDNALGNLENYRSQSSEYSCVKRENGKIKIILDGDCYPVNKLYVKYFSDGKEVYEKFKYDEDTECYIVELEDKLAQDDDGVEIVEIEDEE